MPAEPHVVYTFVKNRDEEIRATLSTFCGHQVADLRVWRADDRDVDFPTKKGIAVRVADLPKLRAAVDALIDEADQAA